MRRDGRDRSDILTSRKDDEKWGIPSRNTSGVEIPIAAETGSPSLTRERLALVNGRTVPTNPCFGPAKG